jgi:uncharacterized membrane protein YheB (UPF0754 family)
MNKMKEELLKLLKELEEELTIVCMPYDKALAIADKIASMRDTIVESKSDVATSQQDIKPPIWPRAGKFKVVKEISDIQNLEKRKDKWFIKGTDIELTEEESQKKWLHILASNNFTRFTTSVPMADYRLFGYRLNDYDEPLMNGGYRWYDNKTKQLVTYLSKLAT